MLPGPPRRRRARPVADAPIDSLLTRSEDLTKGWLLALLEQAPLEQAPGILAADLSRDGPGSARPCCGRSPTTPSSVGSSPKVTLVALVSRVGELAGASGPDGTSQAVDALQAIIWAALRSALPDPDPDLITALAERLAQVTELIRAAALRAGAVAPAGPAPPGSRAEAAPAGSEPRASRGRAAASGGRTAALRACQARSRGVRARLARARGGPGRGAAAERLEPSRGEPEPEARRPSPRCAPG